MVEQVLEVVELPPKNKMRKMLVSFSWFRAQCAHDLESYVKISRIFPTLAPNQHAAHSSFEL